MIIKNSPEYQHFSVDTQKTQLKLLCITGDSGVINFCSGLYQKWDSYHPNRNYQPVLIFNKMEQAEQLQQEPLLLKAPSESYIIVNSLELMDCRKTVLKEASVSKMQENNNNMLDKLDPSTPVAGTQHTANLAANPAKIRDNKAVNISTPEKAKQVTQKTKVKAVSKKQIDTEEGESHYRPTAESDSAVQRWQSERDVVARIVQLGKQLGHQPTILDLYCAGFEPEVNAISDLLQPLLAQHDDDAEAIPWAPLELVVI
jgi:hypothetical protein